ELARRLEAVLAELAQELGLESARDANEVVRELAFHEGVPGPPALRRNIDLEEDQDVVHADRVPARRDRVRRLLRSDGGGLREQVVDERAGLRAGQGLQLRSVGGERQDAVTPRGAGLGGQVLLVQQAADEVDLLRGGGRLRDRECRGGGDLAAPGGRVDAAGAGQVPALALIGELAQAGGEGVAGGHRDHPLGWWCNQYSTGPVLCTTPFATGAAPGEDPMLGDHRMVLPASISALIRWAGNPASTAASCARASSRLAARHFAGVWRGEPGWSTATWAAAFRRRRRTACWSVFMVGSSRWGTGKLARITCFASVILSRWCPQYGT